MSKNKCVLHLVDIDNNVLINDENDIINFWRRRQRLLKYENVKETLEEYKKHYKSSFGEKETCDLIIEDVKLHYPELVKKMKRGDLLENRPETGHRTQGLYCYDGEDLIALCYDYDDYGIPSSDFKLIIEFEPGYWNTDNIEVNEEYHKDPQTYWYYSENIYSPIDLNNFDFRIIEGLKFKYIEFEYKDKNYLIKYDNEDDIMMKKMLVMTDDNSCNEPYLDTSKYDYQLCTTEFY